LSPIHPTALIDPQANIDPTAEIGPWVVVEGPVSIGAGTRIMAHAHISGKTTIGQENEIHMGAVIGHSPQHLAYKGGDSGVIIGNRNVIREYTTIHRAYHPGHNTIIGDGNFFMGLTHVAHDCKVGNRIIMANGSMLGGHVIVEDDANISGNVAVHQYVRIGRLAMAGGVVRLFKDVPPFMLVELHTHIHGLNTVGLRRAGYDQPTRNSIKQAYRILYRSGLNVPQAVERLEAELNDVEPVRELVSFIRHSVRGIAKHTPIKRSTQTDEE
jgi:UDP-N-acetylglucosamine acyltransferase